jgi:hypothetical protein
MALKRKSVLSVKVVAKKIKRSFVPALNDQKPFGGPLYYRGRSPKTLKLAKGFELGWM